MKLYLEVGDVVVVSTILSGLKEYPVLRIEGNRAFTKFRTFSRKIYSPNMVYEYGARYGSTTNEYWLKGGE